MRNNRIFSIRKVGSGAWKIVFTYYGKPYHYVTNNSLAIDRMSSNCNSGKSRQYGYTLMQAYNALYEEGLRENHLGKYKY